MRRVLFMARFLSLPFQALKVAFPTGTFLKNGIVQGIKVCYNTKPRVTQLTLIYASLFSGYSVVPLCSSHWSIVWCLGEKVLSHSCCFLYVCTYPHLATKCHVCPLYCIPHYILLKLMNTSWTYRLANPWMQQSCSLMLCVVLSFTLSNSSQGTPFFFFF